VIWQLIPMLMPVILRRDPAQCSAVRRIFRHHRLSQPSPNFGAAQIADSVGRCSMMLMREMETPIWPITHGDMKVLVAWYVFNVLSRYHWRVLFATKMCQDIDDVSWNIVFREIAKLANRLTDSAFYFRRRLFRKIYFYFNGKPWVTTKRAIYGQIYALNVQVPGFSQTPRVRRFKFD